MKHKTKIHLSLILLSIPCSSSQPPNTLHQESKKDTEKAIRGTILAQDLIAQVNALIQAEQEKRRQALLLFNPKNTSNN